MTCILAVSFALISGGIAPATAQAQERHAAVHFSLGVLSAFLTIPYGIVKTGYAVIGSATGGLAWVLSGGRADTRRIIQPAVRGDYVVTPRNLTMEEPLDFYGVDPWEDQDSSYPYQ